MDTNVPAVDLATRRPLPEIDVPSDLPPNERLARYDERARAFTAWRLACHGDNVERSQQFICGELARLGLPEDKVIEAVDRITIGLLGPWVLKVLGLQDTLDVLESGDVMLDSMICVFLRQRFGIISPGFERAAQEEFEDLGISQTAAVVSEISPATQ